MIGTPKESGHKGDANRLIEKISDACDIDLSNYRRSYVERRVAARMRVLRLKTYRQYCQHLADEPGERVLLLDTLTINVTDFFRDPSMYRFLAKQVLPELVDRKRGSRNRLIRIWSAGCATGEEPYSLAMALLETLGPYGREVHFSVVGTDLDVNALALAKQANYPISRASHIPKALQAKYLEFADDRFTIRPKVTKHVRFRPLDLFSDRPVGMVDLILCRNVFIYFNKDQQEKILEKFWSSLTKGGYLVLGKSEKMPSSMAGKFESIQGRERVYRKTDGL
ncbi:MAG: protein-glutamate O-methyltransferase CheR [Actinobacteria bacterium]|nr:protein-glutamate O-methyltransferase CheR [Actinomycetota bacterium]MCL5887392.1 protein-glutamate O-methyltransferase CheR [Actinomycetota bacterium]